jgi:hypothetical protein
MLPWHLNRVASILFVKLWRRQSSIRWLVIVRVQREGPQVATHPLRSLPLSKDENEMPNMRSSRRQCQKEWQVRNYKQAPRWLPPKEDAKGIPKSVMRQLQNEGISDPVMYNRRLQELLAAHKQGGQHG